MIKHLHVMNYRSLRDVQIELGRFNVLIGPNASGKSNLLDLLQFVADATRGDVIQAAKHRGGLQELLWRGDKAQSFAVNMSFRVDIGTEEAVKTYALEVGARELGNKGPQVKAEALFTEGEEVGDRQYFLQGQWGSGQVYDETTEREEPYSAAGETLGLRAVGFLSRYPTVGAVRVFIEKWTFYRVSPERARSRQPYLSQKHLDPDGSNLAVVLRTLEKEEPTTFEFVVDSLRAAVPSIQRVDTTLDTGRKASLRLREFPFAASFQPESISDGTLRLLAYVVLLRQERLPTLICIEEPDHGLHPELMINLRDILRTAAEKTQIIVTTHSADFVDGLEPHEVITVDKVAGASWFAPVTSVEDLQDWLEDYRLGELWKQRLIGGVIRNSIRIQPGNSRTLSGD